jgi:hypothetical protein
VTTVKRRASAAQFAGVFGSPTPVRRNEPDDQADPGADVVDELPAPAPAEPKRPPAAAPAPPRRRAAARKPAPEPVSEPAGLDAATRRTLDVEARRYVAARRKLDERARDLARAVRAAEACRPEPGEITGILAGAGLPARDLPADLAERLA